MAGSRPSAVERALELEEIRERVLEFLPWQSIVSTAALLSRCWLEESMRTELWVQKQQDHFGSDFLPSGEEPGLASFRHLVQVQRAALSGEEIRMGGTWRGSGDVYEGQVCDAVLHIKWSEGTLPSGDQMWQGAANDGPFFVNQQNILPVDSIVPPDERLGFDDYGRRFSAKHMRSIRGWNEDEHCLMVSGLLEWSPTYSEGGRLLTRDAELEWHATGRTAPRPRFIEYVSGCFAPASRRLLIVGTHLSRAGSGELGLDCYDLHLSEDGMRVHGVTNGNFEGWIHSFSGKVYSLSAQT